MNAIFLLMFTCCCLTQAAENLDKEWRNWKSKYNKQYGPREEGERRQIWERNFHLVESHNNRPGVSFTMRMNMFADQDSVPRRDPIKPMYTGNEPETPDVLIGRWNTPPAFDWRSKGVISPVMNQGPIGDDVAIVITECVESYHAINVGPRFYLSVQEVSDCCAQGELLTNTSFQCIHNIGGLCKAAEYVKSPCNNPQCTQVATVKGGAMVPKGDEAALQMALLKTPIFVAVDASQPSFELYESGIYNEPNCSSSRPDHVLQLVGYGTDSSGTDFWICKNSWGVNWGMYGYINMSRNKSNQCGIASFAMYPV